MQIRRYDPADLDEVVKLFYNTVHIVNAADYTPKQLDAWAPKTMDTSKWAVSLARNSAFVAVEDGIIGFGDITADGYKINVKEYLRSMIPEENVIGRTVPRAVLVFKLKYTESMCRSLSEAIGRADSSGESTAKEDMAKELKVLLQVRGGLLKELNRLA